MGFAYGFLVGGFLFFVGLFVYTAGGWAVASDIKRQCDVQQSIRLVTGSGESFFYCTREPKK